MPSRKISLVKKETGKFIFFLFLILVIVAGFFWFIQKKSGLEMAEAVTQGDVLGWAWIGANCTDQTETSCETQTNPIGWISFSDTNPEITCAGATYQVSVNYDSGEISGAAFIGVGEDADNTDCDTLENSLGWLYFDSTEVPPWASPGDYAKIVGNEIQGWAPIISKDKDGNQTTVTWVHFKGANYSVKINQDGTIGTPGGSDHYAWAGFGSEGGLGWINFSPAFGGVRFPPFNRSPLKPGIDPLYPDGETWEHCSIQALSVPAFHWTYSDPDGDPQENYEIRIDNDSDFSVIDADEFKCGGEICSGNGSTSFTPVPSDWANWMSWDTNYWWIARVKDNQGNWSVWSDPNPFTTPEHAYPWIDFTWSPQFPEINVKVPFTDQSIVYGGATKSAWYWTFQDGNPASSTLQNPEVKFISRGDKQVTLTVSDSTPAPEGPYSCTGSKTATVKLPLPEWIEIPPF